MANRVSKKFWQASNGEALGTALASRPELKTLNESELKEIFALLPPLEGCQVLELGAGTGRFTGELARRSQSVTALDISTEALQQNRLKHSQFDNITYQSIDALEYHNDAEPFDFIFINWLFMYLDDDDSQSLLQNLQAELKPGGQIFIRESCEYAYNGKSWLHNFLHSSWQTLKPGTQQSIYRLKKFRGPFWKNALWMTFNSAKVQRYRTVENYQRLFSAHFDILASGHLLTYELAYRHQNQRYWMLRKSAANVGDGIEAAPRSWSFGGEVWRHFDSHINRSIPFYPQLHETIIRLSEQLLPQNGVVYELGCSTGRLCKQLKQRIPHARIIGVDVEPNMIQAAKSAGDAVQYECADIREYDMAPCSVAILSYTLQFIEPTQRLNLLKKIQSRLQPGGAVILAEKIKRRDQRLEQLMQRAHSQYKVDQGFSKAEISAKSESLAGVMTPLYEDENIELLEQAGLTRISPIFNNLTFCAWIAFKD
ncbi:methyltransferase domain-containing protein [Gilvimarinus chinensis]|uniref:methyltransferase domain-containing protein n=1 Tax=Gilvimarinus chinensis TaxID=396005 RepID=UPI00036C20AA|nr:methyltransferase domain-containing protein [Gilvimarinus chinensis]